MDRVGWADKVLTVKAAKIIVVVLLATAALAQRQMVNSHPQFDGNWWGNTSSGERTGFLYALDDCLTFDRKPALLFDQTWAHYEYELTRYFSSSAANRAKPVIEVFRQFGKPATSKDNGERYGGEFWRAHSDTARHGFVEGYFTCRADDSNVLKWSKPIDFYVQVLNDAYNVDDRKGENAVEYGGPIASVLERVKDPK